MGEVLCSTENSPFLIIDHIHAKINRVCCAALAIGKKCMNVRKNKLLENNHLIFHINDYKAHLSSLPSQFDKYISIGLNTCIKIAVFSQNFTATAAKFDE